MLPATTGPVPQGEVDKDKERLTRAGEEAEVDALSLGVQYLIPNWREPECSAFQEAVRMLLETLLGEFEGDADAPCMATILAREGAPGRGRR